MTSLAGQATMRMPPLSRDSIERVAELFLEEVAPATLETPCRLDVADLVDHVLPCYGIHFSPAELADSEALTDPSGSGPVEILMDVEQFNALPLLDRKANRPRSTACHEIGHALIHVPVIRKRRDRSPQLAHMALQRVDRREIEAFRCAETLITLGTSSPDLVAATFGVSTALAAQRLREFPSHRSRRPTAPY